MLKAKRDAGWVWKDTKGAGAVPILSASRVVALLAIPLIMTGELYRREQVKFFWVVEVNTSLVAQLAKLDLKSARFQRTTIKANFNSSRSSCSATRNQQSASQRLRRQASHYFA